MHIFSKESEFLLKLTHYLSTQNWGGECCACVLTNAHKTLSDFAGHRHSIFGGRKLKTEDGK